MQLAVSGGPLCGRLQYLLLGAVAIGLLVAQQSQAGGGADSALVPAELVAAIKQLKTADADGRQKIYDLLAAKGDARLNPALRAYKDGSLLLRDDRLMLFGERETVKDKGSVLPLLDALTHQNVLGPDGQPLYFPRPDLSTAIRAPRLLSEKKAVADLIATLSLLDPDPVVRIASIRDAGERAARAMPDPDDAARLLDALSKCSMALNAKLATATVDEKTVISPAIAAIAAANADRPQSVASPVPGNASVSAAKVALTKVQLATASDASLATTLKDTIAATSTYLDHMDAHQALLEELPKTAAALKRQLEKDPKGQFAPALNESIASIELVTSTDAATRIASAAALGKMGTSRAANLLDKIALAAQRMGDKELESAATAARDSANRYQTFAHSVQNTFAGLSLGSILVLLALGLSIIFGLMGVINMAQGEFMMVGAFTTFVVANFFNQHLPQYYGYYLAIAIPAAFLVSALVGYFVEATAIRHLYGRPLETLLATWGVGLVMIWAVRWKFGDNVSIRPPRWMEGGWEIAPDIVFPLNRVYIILFCAICIAIVYFVVNGTKLGLLLRATTQNREMALALGVPTRRIDGLTFAFGAGLAGLAGVAVPLYDKIKPEMGQDYIVDCFMVVVVGGVGKLAGAVWAGLGLGFIGKYLEPILGAMPSLASGASVIGKVLVLGMIILFLQWRPQGLFPPKGRQTDA